MMEIDLANNHLRNSILLYDGTKLALLLYPDYILQKYIRVSVLIYNRYEYISCPYFTDLHT